MTEWPETDISKMTKEQRLDLVNTGLTIPAGDGTLFIAKLKLFCVVLQQEGKMSDEMLGHAHAICNEFIGTIHTLHKNPEEEILFDALMGNLFGYTVAALKTPGGIVDLRAKDVVRH